MSRVLTAATTTTFDRPFPEAGGAHEHQACLQERRVGRDRKFSGKS